MPSNGGGDQHMRRAVFLLGSCLTAGLVGGCGQTTETESSSQPPWVFTEHRFALTAQSSQARVVPRPLGADCAVGGREACSSGLCIHTATAPSSGWKCSKTCIGHEDCPTGWACVASHPNGNSSFCVPEAAR
jgi:hypothetical protein